MIKFDIKIDEARPDLWQKLGSIGISPYESNSGIIYQYVSFDTAIKILKSQCLQYSSPSKFNDPFDLSIGFLDTTISSDRIQKLASGIISPREVREKIIENHSKNPLWFSNYFDNAINETKSQIGISCFSKSHTKTLMWSHYADKHAGVCFGFSFKNIAGDGLMQFCVRYEDKIESVSYFEDTIFSIYNWLFTKSKVWEYEEEIRRVYVDKNGLIPFSKEELVEIYYGVRLTDEQITEINNLINERNFTNITTRKSMKVDASTFDLAEVDYVPMEKVNIV